MKLIDKYMLSRFFVPFGICVAAFCMLFVVVDMFEHLSDFIEAGTPVVQVARFYVFYLPALVVFIMPISILLGLLYSLWQLTRRNELTAMRASGIGFARLTLPLLIFGLFAGILTGLVNETVAPWSTYWAQQYVERIKNKGELRRSSSRGLRIRTWNSAGPGSSESSTGPILT
ncbi:MAG: LptF/LptG family permease [Lentisphaerae bacterium]|nr:LptF/LptG family permease [Lentisphaerota bacterium]